MKCEAGHILSEKNEIDYPWQWCCPFLLMQNVFPQASHTVSMERRTPSRLAAGTSAMKYTRTKNEQEIKKQEIKNLKTLCISENEQRHCQGESISFFS